MPTGEIHLTSSLQYDAVDQAVKKLEAYFAPLSGTNTGFTGGIFDSFDPSATRTASADMFTSDDVVAVSLLSVDVYGRAAVELLARQRPRFSALLQRVGPDRDLVDVESTSPKDFAAHDLYWALRELPRVGATTASKLMARKRPRLIPIYDSVINTHLLRGSRILWEPLRQKLRADNARLNHHLLHLRSCAGLSPHVSAIRVFDVLAWMDGKKYWDTPPATASDPQPDEAEHRHSHRCRPPIGCRGGTPNSGRRARTLHPSGELPRPRSSS